MKLALETPSKLRFKELSDTEYMGLQNLLKYKDNTIEEQMRRIRKTPFYVARYGEEWVQDQLVELGKLLYKTLIFEDQDGLYTLPGLKDRLMRSFPDSEYDNLVHYPDFKLRPWVKEPPYSPKIYQSEAFDALLNSPHSHVEIATGMGKTFIAVLLAKHTGLPTVISTPSAGLARSLYKLLVDYFGKKNVGLFGDGKKEIGKDILVAVGKSLSMVQDEDVLKKFAKYQVFISDESHTLPANQFNYFCHSVLGHCPYRWFLSATQERNDGKDILLEGIIGNRVYAKTIKEGQESGDLAKLSTLIFDVPSFSYFHSSLNAVKMNQKHFYNNEYILNLIGTIVPNALEQGLPVLILIDHHEQELLLRAKIGLVYTYARGGSDTSQICQDFNDGKIMCVVGTSAVSVGTDFKPVRLTINWQGGKAETKFKQGVIGRSTRVDPSTGKTDCRIIDFRVYNIPMLKRHANARIRLFKEVGPVQIVEYKG